MSETRHNTLNRLRNYLYTVADNHAALLGFAVTCPITTGDVSEAKSDQELFRLSQRLVHDYEEWRYLVSYFEESVEIAKSLTSAMSEIEGLFPCPDCGGLVVEKECQECGYDLTEVAERGVVRDKDGDVVTLFGTLPQGTPDYESLLDKVNVAALEKRFARVKRSVSD